MRIAPRVHTSPDDIARLNACIAALPNGAHVELRLDDGEQLRGIVGARAMLQLFYDTAGNEGANAIVRLEQPALEHPDAAGWLDVWLDRVVEVRRLDPQRHLH